MDGVLEAWEAELVDEEEVAASLRGFSPLPARSRSSLSSGVKEDSPVSTFH